MSASAPAPILGSINKQRQKEQDVRSSNIIAAKAVADCIRTSLGPKGMDKMIACGSDVSITNDGATIMSELKVNHPAAKMMVEMSKAQDVEAGDGTTSVVVLAGALMGACQKLSHKGIHPSVIAESFTKANWYAQSVLKEIAIPLDLGDRETLLKSASTSLNSKVVSQYSSILAPIAVDSVLSIIDPKTSTNLNLKDIRMIKKLGGTIDDTQMVRGIVFDTAQCYIQGSGITRVENAKIGLLCFCISRPRPYLDSQLQVTDYTHMDKMLGDERKYVLSIVQKLKKAGCNVVLIQKNIIRDAVTDMSCHYMNKMGIMVINDIERPEMDLIAKTINAMPVASIETFTPDKLGSADLVEEIHSSGGKMVKVTGVPNPGRTVTIVCRGSNKLVLDECERSIHDALCVLRSLVRSKYLIAGGGAPEIELSLRLTEYANTLGGMEAYCVRAYAEALEVVPYTLSENAGLDPIAIVTELRNKHVEGKKTFGINVRKGAVTDILEENVLQPLLVTSSALTLATETVVMLLKIDDVVIAR